jgi:hypothetical protein
MAGEYMGRHRDEEDAYISACNSVFNLPLFPLNLNLKISSPLLPVGAVREAAKSTLALATGEKTNRSNDEIDDRYKPEFIFLSRISTGVRMQRLLLANELNNIEKKIQDLKILDKKCVEKKNFLRKQVMILESELIVVVQDDMNLCEDKFNAFLNLTRGKDFFIKFLIGVYDTFQDDIDNDDKAVALLENNDSTINNNDDKVINDEKNDAMKRTQIITNNKTLINKLMSNISCTKETERLSIDDLTVVYNLFILWSAVDVIKLRYTEVKIIEKKGKRNRSTDKISKKLKIEESNRDIGKVDIDVIQDSNDDDSGYMNDDYDCYDNNESNEMHYSIPEKLSQISILKERQGIFNWLEVCKFLQIKNSDASENPDNMDIRIGQNENKKDFKIVMNILLNKIEKNDTNFKIISPSIVDEIKNELFGCTDFLSQKLIYLLIHVNDKLASKMYEFISNSLRDSLLWVDVLEEIRLDRSNDTYVYTFMYLYVRICCTCGCVYKFVYGCTFVVGGCSRRN